MRVLGICLLAIAVCHAHGSVQEERGNTMGKVVSLLEGMLDKSKEDGTNDREIFAKFKCYCDKNAAEKAASIADLTTEIAKLDGEIEELAGKSKKLSTEVAVLDKEMNSNEQARNDAASLREKANADFVSEEEDMNQAMNQMDVAIQTLEDITVPSEGGAAASLTSTSSKVAKKLRGQDMSLGLPTDTKRALKAAAIFLSPTDRKLVSNFIQMPAASGSYAKQAGGIVGILKQMKDTFKVNLVNAQAGEAAAVETHTNYMDSAQAAYDAMKETMDAKSDLLGSNDGSLGTAKTAYDTAQTNKAEEEEFVASLNQMCLDKTNEYEDRKVMRANEEAAVAKAISILNSDSAFDVFGKTAATSTGATGLFFLQQKAQKKKSVRANVQKLLSNAARGQASLRLGKLVAMLETNPFDIVVKQIQKQMDLIDKEEQADDDQKAWCDSERENNDALIEDKKSNIERLQGELDQTISDIETPGDGLKAVLAEAQKNLVDTQTAMQTITADRQASNGEYRQNVANLAEAEETIEKALKVLVDYYDWLHRKQAPHSYAKKGGKGSPGGGIKRLAGASVEELEEACSADPNCAGFSTDGWLKKELAPEDDWYDGNTDLYVKEYEGTSSVTGNFLQLRQKKSLKKEDPEPPSTWEDESAESGGGFAGQTAKGGDAVSMLRFILDETKAEEKTAHETEEKAQADYEDEMTRLKGEEDTFLSTVADTENSLADKEKQKAETATNLDETKKDKASIENFLADIKHNCDFINENMDVRKETRRSEKSALNEAKNSLTGTPEYEAAEEEEKAKEEAKGKMTQTSGTF